MNINLNIKLPIKNSSNYLSVNADTLLKPFYITEKELLNVYLTSYPKEYIKTARELIFSSSVKADELIGKNLSHLSQKELFIIKKNLTLCLSIISFGNRFNTDFIKSLSRSKTLAEFSVSTSSTNDPTFVINIIKDAKECVEEITALLNDGGLIKSFVKSELNPNSRVSNRLWYASEFNPKSTAAFANSKVFYNGRYYKDGIL